MSDQELNLKFVKEVEKHEELYNYRLPAYSRKDLTEKAWQDVAAQVNMPGMKSSVSLGFWRQSFKFFFLLV